MTAQAHRPLKLLRAQWLLRGRWLIVAAWLMVTIVLEVLEGHALDAHFLIEVIMYGAVLPAGAWLLITSLATAWQRHSQHEAILEFREQVLGRIAELHNYEALARYLVSFPADILPVGYAALHVYNHREARLEPVTFWTSILTLDLIAARRPDPLAVCRDCLLKKPPLKPAANWCHQAACRLIEQDPSSYYLPLLYDGLLVGVLNIAPKAGSTFAKEQLGLLNSLARNMALALILAIAQRRQTDQVRSEARADERRRLSHDLHDSLAQELVYLHLELDRLAASHDLTDPLRARLSQLRDVAETAYDQVRHNLAGLRLWQHATLVEAVAELAQSARDRSGLDIEVVERGEAARLPADRAQAIFDLVVEALNNVRQHARARQVGVTIDWSATALTVTVADDGIGFEVNGQPRPGHHGLALMREAVSVLRGQLGVDSRPGEGTRLQICLPINPPDADPTSILSDPS